MKNNKFILLLLLIGVFTACNKNDKEEIAIINFKLTGACSWVYPTNNEKVYIINSEEEFLPFIVCDNETGQNIDFEKYSLMLVQLVFPSAGYEIKSKRLVKDDNLDYTLYAEIKHLGGDNPQQPVNYFIPILVSKIDANISIKIIKSGQ